MPWRTLPRNIPDMKTTKMGASRGTIRWDDHARRTARANGQSGAGRVAVTGDLSDSPLDVVPSRRRPKASHRDAIAWRSLALLAATTIMLMVVATNFADLESWHWGGPGARHTEDIEPELRATWDKICLTCWMRP